jgi:succinate dehydrogenase (ubiquinone) iron-sulfur subunit
VKDLVPDMNNFYNQYRSIQPWLQRKYVDKICKVLEFQNNFLILFRNEKTEEKGNAQYLQVSSVITRDKL